MVHQPIEKWIIEETPLTAEQKIQLEEHLRMCKHCRDLQNSLLEVDELLLQAEIAAPADGFTQRFQASIGGTKGAEKSASGEEILFEFARCCHGDLWRNGFVHCLDQFTG